MTEINIKEDALETLDSFIFNNIWNHRNPDEDNWDITFEGFEFLLRHRDSGAMFNFRVEYVPGSLTEDDKIRLGSEQEWFEDDSCS